MQHPDPGVENHGRIVDSGQFAQRGADLLRFDPVSAQFDLAVDPAEKHHAAIGEEVPLVSRAADPVRHVAGGRIRHKAALRPLRVAEVSAAQVGRANQDFRGLPDARRMSRRVADQQLDAGDGFAHRDWIVDPFPVRGPPPGVTTS